jgi:GNAT superfamily N-acetyltransferase
MSRRPEQPLDLGSFVAEEEFASSDVPAAREEGDFSKFDNRVFRCASRTKGGRAVALSLEVITEKVTSSSGKKSYFRFQILPYSLSGRFILGDTPLTFVLKREEDSLTVEDIRVYLHRDFRGRGFAFLLVSFVKAFFFPFYIPVAPRQSRLISLPLGGSWQVERLSVLPTAHIAKSFYTQQGFKRFSAEGFSKWLFWPKSRAESALAKALLEVILPILPPCHCPVAVDHSEVVGPDSSCDSDSSAEVDLTVSQC